MTLVGCGTVRPSPSRRNSPQAASFLSFKYQEKAFSPIERRNLGSKLATAFGTPTPNRRIPGAAARWLQCETAACCLHTFVRFDSGQSQQGGSATSPSVALRSFHSFVKIAEYPTFELCQPFLPAAATLNASDKYLYNCYQWNQCTIRKVPSLQRAQSTQRESLAQRRQIDSGRTGLHK